MAEPILIWGAGAIGGTLGACWARAGIAVQLVDVDAGHVEASRSRGLSIHGPVEDFRVRVPAQTPDELTGTFERIVLAVKAHHTAAALEALAPHLAEDGYVLSAQNGLNELTIAERLGAACTLGCFVNFGADWHGPGDILYGNRGAVVVGEIDGSIRERTREMHRLLRLFEADAVLTDNIWGYLWGKLAYGAMLFATALTPDAMAANFADRARTGVFKALGREVVATAQARGVRPIGFDGFDPDGFRPGAPEGAAEASIARLADFNQGSAKSHSGVWRDLAVRRRRTEVDFQIGTVVELARKAGIATPVLAALVGLIHDVEEGRRPQAFETFAVLIETCSSASTAAS